MSDEQAEVCRFPAPDLRLRVRIGQGPAAQLVGCDVPPFGPVPTDEEIEYAIRRAFEQVLTDTLRIAKGMWR